MKNGIHGHMVSLFSKENKKIYFFYHFSTVITNTKLDWLERGHVTRDALMKT